MRGVALGWRCAALAAALCAAAGAACAQTPSPGNAPAPGLTLAQALASATERSGGVRQAREQLSAARGGALAASGAFDPTVTSFVTSTRDNQLRWSGAGADAVQPSRALGVRYGVALERQFRSGLVVSPGIEATRKEFSPDATGRNSTASASLVVGMPLLRGAGGQLAAPERAAGALAGAARADLMHAASVGALEAARAYWAYAAAAERLEVQRQAEERSRRLVEQTRILVSAQERAQADLNPLLAALASRQAARSAAEQDLAEARRTLGLAMGVDGDSIALLPLPSTPLPVGGPGAPLAADALVAQAVARRMDLAAARQAAGAQRVLADAAQAGTRPRLDLQLSVGYTGAVPGESWSSLVTPFYRDLNTWSASLEVSWQAALRNATAAGTAAQTRAVQRQGEVAAQELEREIRSGVAVAAQALRHGQAELERADEAVTLSRTSVENEERKFQLGMSTLFDIIQSEDALTSALLSRISAQERFADARARLAYETGALVRDEDGRPVAAPSAVAFSPSP
ncbi:TolC family protein [Longimicrobium sp.]|uniref:TolC family protein n=1 Tax=Longimicrobium sp. TaxID=2029185 RepID=UPI002B8560F2|nr:TolC family protein [Longimicrobium sp.]HSU14670.1 TolC family protein [Longimicrobium sp.]